MSAVPIFEKFFSPRGRHAHTALLLCVSAALAPALARGGDRHERQPAEPAASPDPGPRESLNRSGEIQTRNGLTLHLKTDLGAVRIVPLDASVPPEVRYTVHVETDAPARTAARLLEKYTLTAKATSSGVEIIGELPPQSKRGGRNAQFWVQFEVNVPASYSLDVSTGIGDIETQDIGGGATLVTQAGNVRTGRIGTMGLRSMPQGRPLAKVSTEGGHIQVQDVAGDLDAFTAGGHIVAGNISGDASLRSGGGHIRAGQIGGRAQLETDGGNITLKQAGSFVAVRTGGGQIDFGEVHGSVRAQTGGGGIRIITVSGPMEVESNGGSICLTRVAGAVRAATAGGNIQAWINPEMNSNGTVSLAGASQLSSGAGDIVVFLPRNLAATIDAQVESGGTGRIDADPALPLIVQLPGNRLAGPVHATAALNGGGELLKLRTTIGRIRLQFLDTNFALRDSLIREQKERINSWQDGDFLPVKNSRLATAADAQGPLSFEGKNDWLEGWMDNLEIWLLGGLREDSGDFMKRLVAQPKPTYPELARHARIQGMVVLQVKVKTDGSVEVQKVLQGEPVLAEAATETVNKRWRARPAVINGTKVETISTVKFDFELP
ncbi:MAG TPA: energy transducer TonB [Candidatus Methylomirabilis sp.]|nr:energy transducer TonB [Candidatus Methylomirabilis sp.]